MSENVDTDAVEWAKMEFTPEEDEDTGVGMSKGKKHAGRQGGRIELDKGEDGHLRVPADYKDWDHKLGKECVRSLVNYEWRKSYHILLAPL